jgi:hypothetical protein
MESIYIPGREEIGEMFRDIYMDGVIFDRFETEFNRIYDQIESSVNINQRALDSIDMDALFGGF